MIYDHGEIVAVVVDGGKVVCAGCFSDLDPEEYGGEITQEQLIVDGALFENEQAAFCDICNRQI